LSKDEGRYQLCLYSVAAARYDKVITMTTPKAKADSFRQLDFHDDTLISVRVFPAQRRKDGQASIVEVQFQRHPKTLSESFSSPDAPT